MLLVVGPSGSGKSTLARVIAGLLPGASPGELGGSLLVDGAPPAAGGAGIVFQDPASQIVMELAGDDVAFGLENLDWPRPRMRSRVPGVLAQVGLDGFEDRRTNRLSGGEQQRVAIAGTLAPERPVLVLDEPTANLDPDGAAGTFDRIRAIARARAQTVVLIEHRAEAWDLADVVLAIDHDGAQVDVGPPAEVLARSRERLDAAGVWLPPEGSKASPRRRGVRNGSAHAGQVLAVEQAWFGFERSHPVLHGVDLDVSAGERVCLVGPNGSGKSTLLRLVIGSLRPTAGRLSILGDAPSRLRPAAVARRVGYVVQDPELGFMGETIGDELSLGLESRDRERARELAGRLRLDVDGLAARSPYLLSGGEQRRLSIVTALARRPPLLVLDEPTFGQDRRGWEALVEAIDELVEAGTGVLAATHDQRFVEAVADRVVRLDEGWVVAA